MPDAAMKTEDKTVYDASRPKGSSVGTMTNEEIINAQKAAGTSDPLAAFTGPGARARSIQMSGQADPAFAGHGLSIGQRVYHKVKKVEGSIMDMKASGTVEVRKDNGVKFWANPVNLVKL